MRYAIFGGSFDPPHLGHLLAAGDAFDQLSLERICFVPAGIQPLKIGRASAPPEHRLAMTRLMVEGDSRFEVSPVEVERGGLSFTVDTVRYFADRYPNGEAYLLLGADVPATFDQWKEPERILELARPALLARSEGSEGGSGGSVGARGGAGERLLERAGLVRLNTRRVDISSTEIRERAREGKSLRGFVTESVAAYIERCRLYR